jgi:hypothetical protein
MREQSVRRVRPRISLRSSGLRLLVLFTLPLQGRVKRACGSRAPITDSIVKQPSAIVPGIFAAPGRRLFFRPRTIPASAGTRVRGMERRAAPLKSTPCGAGAWQAGRARASRRSTGGIFRSRAALSGAALPPRSASSWRGDRSVPQAEPRAARVQVYETCPQEPHSTPLQ